MGGRKREKFKITYIHWSVKYPSMAMGKSANGKSRNHEEKVLYNMKSC
jgi:hypothetical protein